MNCCLYDSIDLLNVHMVYIHITYVADKYV